MLRLQRALLPGASAASQTLLKAAYADFATPSSTRSYGLDATHLSAALENKGVRAGGGGRSSVSGITATVFGCTGFLGRYVVNGLARQGSQVVIPYRCDELDAQHLKTMGDLGQIVTFADFNVRDDALLRKAVSQSNVVINLMGIERETPRFRFEEVHIDVARRVAEAAKDSGVCERLVHVSCLGSSADAPSRRLRTKAAGEAAVREAFPEATIVRPAVMTGVEDRLFNEYARLAKLLPVLLGGGEAKLQPVFVRDVADGIVQALKDRGTLGKDIDLAGPAVFTRKELLEITYETMREKYGGISVPNALLKLGAKPREWLLQKGVPIPTMTMYTEDYIDESAADVVLQPQPGVLTFADLGIEPQQVNHGVPIEHVRHYRVGGYEFGTENTEAHV